jgi:16S rRNA (cytosine967-C5)-methyltransferase
LQKLTKDTIHTLVSLLTQFLEGEGGGIPEIHRGNPTILHYYTEIIRFWNRLNFLIQRTLTSLKQKRIESADLLAIHLLATYRRQYESVPIRTVLDELKAAYPRLDSTDEISQYLIKLQSFSWEIALRTKGLIERISLTEATPTFLINQLLPFMLEQFLQANLHAMNDHLAQAEFTVRINIEPTPAVILRLRHDLRELGVHFSPDPELTRLLNIPRDKKAELIQSEWYQSGKIILQDKASAMIGAILAAEPGDRIWDVCAAPGMKTSYIAQSCDGRMIILATDVHTHRLYQMKKLMELLEMNTIHLLNADGYTSTFKPETQFDRVLLDAPCTGSGTFLTNPILKWRQNKGFLEQNAALQSRLLDAALRALQISGTLVYSTCSLYAQEGELQIQNFLEYLDPLDLPDWLSPSYSIQGTTIPGTGRLFPALHQTQGFFIAKFKKIRAYP